MPENCVDSFLDVGFNKLFENLPKFKAHEFNFDTGLYSSIFDRIAK